MLELQLFIIMTQTHVYLELIANIQFQLLTRKELIQYIINENRSFSKTTLAPLVIINSFVSDVYMEHIANMKCQIQCIHLDQCFIQQNQEINCRHLCYHNCVFTSVYIFIRCVRKNNQYPTLDNPDNDNILIHSYYQERFQTFMLVLYLFLACFLTLVYFEVIANIQCQIFTKNTLFY